MELDFDKYCIIDGSPTTVLPAPRIRLSSANRKSSGDSKYRNNLSSLSKACTERNNLHHYRSASCRDVRSRSSNEFQNRGSVHKISREVDRKHDFNERKKIEFSRGAVSEISCGIIDSLCSSDEDGSVVERKRSSVMYESEQSTSSSSCKNQMEFSKSKVWFNPSKKIIDPFARSKPGRIPLSPEQRTGLEIMSSGCASMPLEDVICKPLMSDLSEKIDTVYSDPSGSSPAHIRGVLRVVKKCDEVLNYEFSVKSPEDVYVAKAWKVAEREQTRVYYTFHSLHQIRKSNVSGLGFKHKLQESTVLAQMNVSCYLSTEEEKVDGSLNESMIRELVLYDVHEENWSPSSCKQNKTTTKSNHNTQLKPQPSSEMDPGQEIAAIVIKAPSEKRERLRIKSGDRKTDLPLSTLLDRRRHEQAMMGISDNSSRGSIHIVIPDGTHGGGPSPLLDRWRLGGRCDCGGWDMACPLNVFANSNLQMDNQKCSQIFALGRKDKSPWFTMRQMMEDGRYAVDFHAKLSSLQAFSICVAILHSADAPPFTSPVHARRDQILENNISLTSFSEEGIKTVVVERSDDGKYIKAKKISEGMSPSFVVHPPFSPIARV